MLPYIGPEFIEVLQSLMNRRNNDRPPTISQHPPVRKGTNRPTPLLRETSRVRSFTLAVPTSKWIRSLQFSRHRWWTNPVCSLFRKLRTSRVFPTQMVKEELK